MPFIDCPVEHRGFEPLNHQTHSDDWDALRKLLVSKKPKTVVEVGTWAGATTLLFAEFAERIYCVDHWMGAKTDRLGEIGRFYGSEVVFGTFCRNMGERLFKQVIPIRGDSLKIADVWPLGFKVDFVYLDAAHDSDSIVRDIEMWCVHVRRGGIISGHDYAPEHFPAVVEAVNRIKPTGIEAAVWWKEM